MSRRRTGILVKLFNFVYIAAAGISIYALCTRPIIKANVHVSLTQDKVATILSKAFGANSSEGSESSESRLVFKASRREVKDYVTKERIATYFPNGYEADIPFEVTAKQAFQINNKHLLDDIIQINLGTIVDNVYAGLEKPLDSLFKTIVEDFAKDSLTDEINKQIAEHFPDGAPASDEEVQRVFDNVYSLLDGDEPVTVDQLAETILHGKDGDNSGVLDIINSRGYKYVAWEPQPSEEEVNLDITAAGDEQQYFLRGSGFAHNTAAYSDTAVYYEQTAPNVFVECDPQPTQEAVEEDRTAEEGSELYFVIVYHYYHNEDPFDSSVTYYKKTQYTSDDVDDQKIASMMTDSLEGVDGLVSKIPHLCSPQPTQTDVEEDIAKENEKDRIYYVLDENNNPILPTSYDSSVLYYTVEKVVNDLDTAMAALIDSFLNGSSSGGRKLLRAEEAVEASNQPKSISENIKDYLYNMIPSNVTESAGVVGEKAPFILLALIAIFALPWVWFTLVTVLRTVRPLKCWTRPMIILFWCLPQLILGLGLTYGIKYIFPLLAERIQALNDYANSFNFDVRTGCLIPSFVYLGVAAMTLIYWIIRRPMKFQYKMEKRIGWHTRLPKRPREPKPVRQPIVKGAPRQPKPTRKPKYLIPRDPDEYY